MIENTQSRTKIVRNLMNSVTLKESM